MHDPASHAHSHVRAEVMISPSLLRLSAVQRLAIAGVLAALLWATVAWALMDIPA
jgi:hypothetical protein